MGIGHSMVGSGSGRLPGCLAGDNPRPGAPPGSSHPKYNLGDALTTLGERKSDTAQLKQAHRHIKEAWRAYKDAGMDQHDGELRQRLAAIDQLIIERQ